MQLVFEQLPGVVSQQSRSLWQFPKLSEQAQDPVSQKLLPQSESCVHESPASAQPQVWLAPPHVLAQQSLSPPQSDPPVTHPQMPKTHGLSPQQSASVLHVSPWLEQSEPQRFVLGSQRSAPQQSELLSQNWPVVWQAQVPVESHRSAPQQSELEPQALPACWHAQVLLVPSQSSTPQQSPLLVQPAPVNAQPQVPFTHRAEQQSAAVVQARPSSTHAPASVVAPVPQESVLGSQSRAPQQSRSEKQRPPVPAHAGAQVPKSQKTEQQSPSLVQLLSSWMHAGTPASVIGRPASAPPPWPASEPTPPPPVDPFTHLPAAQFCEQQVAKPTHD